MRTSTWQETLNSWTNDFVGFASNLDVIDKDGKRIKIRPGPLQRLYEKVRTPRDIVLKARQVHMTTWEMARDVWFFLTQPNSNVVIFCQSEKEESALRNLSERCRVMLGLDHQALTHPDRCLGLRGVFPELASPLTGIIEVSMTEWAYNGSKLIILGSGANATSAGKKGLGWTIRRLHVTEISSFEYAEESMSAIFATIPPLNSEVVFESTPKGRAGHFYKIYKEAKEKRGKYTAHFYPWFVQSEYVEALVPGEVVVPETDRERELVELYKVTPEQLKWYKLMLSEQGNQAKMDQMYPCDEETCWQLDGRTFFDKTALSDMAIVAKPNRPLTRAGAALVGQHLKVWHEPEQGKTYVIAVDPSSGGGEDPCAIQILERGTGKHCACVREYLRPEEIAATAANVAAYYNWGLIVVERSSSFEAVHLTLSHWVRPGEDIGFGYPHVYSHGDRSRGFPMSELTRPAVLDSLEIAVRKRHFVTLDKELIEEMHSFIVNKKGRAEAQSGAHDDRIMALAIAWEIQKVSLGLSYQEFGEAPSISIENNTIAYDNIQAQLAYDPKRDIAARKVGQVAPSFTTRDDNAYDGF